MPRIRPSGMEGWNVTLLDVIVGVELFILALIYSRTYSFFPSFRSPLNWAAFIIPLAFIPVALMRYAYAALATLVVIAILFAYQWWFANLWGTPFTGTALGTYQGLLLGAMIAVHARGQGPSRFLTIFFIAAMCYLALYLYLYSTIDAMAITLQQMQGNDDFAASIRRTHDARGGSLADNEYKIGTSGVIMSFLVLYSLGMLLYARNLSARFAISVLLIITTYSLIIADSRFNTLVTGIAFITMLIPISARWRATAGLFIAAAGMIVYTVAALVSFNMFSVLRNDVTGLARFEEFLVANPVFLTSSTLGVGLKNSADDFASVFPGDVYTSDLGWYGELIQTGLIGIILLLFSHILLARYISWLSRTDDGQLAPRVLSGMLMYLALVQFLTPQYWEGAGSILLSMALAYCGVRQVGTQEGELRASAT